MRRITLSNDITHDVPRPCGMSATPEGWDAYHAAEAHARTERARHDAWHATFNAAMSSGHYDTFDIARRIATSAHGPVKWFGTDEDVI